MKTLILLFLPVLASWCSGQGNQTMLEAKKNNNSLIGKKKGREPEFEKIRVIYKTSGQYYNKIEFWDNNDSMLIKTIDLEQLNPFNQLPFRKTGIAYGTHKYMLKNEKTSTIERYIGKWITSRYVFDQEPYSADGQIVVEEPQPGSNFISVAYNFYLTNKVNQVLAIISEMVVYDNRGNVINTIKDSQSGQAPIVSKDGKYLALKYGGIYSECGSGYLSEGITFYEVESGKKVASDTLERDTWVYYFPICDYFVSIEQIGGGDSAKNIFTIYNLSRKEKYVRLFDMKTLGIPGVVVAEDYCTDGVYYHIYEQGGIQYKYGDIRRKATFEKDFKIIKL